MALGMVAMEPGLNHTAEPSSQGMPMPALTLPAMHALCWSTMEPCACSGAPAAANAAAAMQALTRLRLIRDLLWRVRSLGARRAPGRLRISADRVAFGQCRQGRSARGTILRTLSTVKPKALRGAEIRLSGAQSPARDERHRQGADGVQHRHR